MLSLFVFLVVVPIMSYFGLFYNFRLVTEALQKMKGKIPEIAGSHISSRILQVYELVYIFFQLSVSHNFTRACSLNLLLSFCFNQKTCVKHCSQAERDAVFEELSPHLLNLAYNAYAVHLVKKMLDNGMVYMKYT